jgi:hypothetical protein
MAAAGYVKLKQVDRSLLVELADRADQQEAEKEAVPTNGHAAEQAQQAQAPAPVSPTPAQMEEGVRVMQDVFQNAKSAPHWPMYLRNVKQFIKNASPSFDERRYGFQSFLDAVRSAQRAGLFRLERNRQGILRVFPGNQISQPQRVAPSSAHEAVEETPAVEPSITVEDRPAVQEFQPSTEPVIEAQPDEVAEAQNEPTDFSLVSPGPATEEKPVRKRRASSGIKRKTVAPRTKAGSLAGRTRKKSTPPGEEGPG